MFGRMDSTKSTRRVAVFATIAMFGISAIVPVGGAIAAPATNAAGKQVSAGHGVSGATDFSAARRRYARRGHGNAAGLAAFGAIVGTIGAIAASQNRRDYYYDGGPGYGYYRGGPGYYGGPAYYGGRGYY